MSSRDYAVMREEIRSDPVMRREHVKMCVRAFGRTPERRAFWAKHMHTTSSKAPNVACARLVRAIANGRLTWEEFDGQEGSAKVLAIILG